MKGDEKILRLAQGVSGIVAQVETHHDLFALHRRQLQRRTGHFDYAAVGMQAYCHKQGKNKGIS